MKKSIIRSCKSCSKNYSRAGYYCDKCVYRKNKLTCPKCNEPMSRSAKTCRSCNNISGRNNPNYKDGHTCSTSYCACGKEKDFRSISCSNCRVNDLETILAYISEATSFVNLAFLTKIPRRTIYRTVTDNNLDVSHFSRRLCRVKKYLVKSNTKRYALIKEIILSKNLLPYECASCSLTGNWNNKTLILDLDHINGDPTDNRLKNLRFLCPNCHSQTKTYKGRNSRGTKKQSRR